MTTLTATTAENGLVNVSITNGEQTIDRKGKGFLRTIVNAYIVLRLQEFSEMLEAFTA
jgi:hypothetical protein